MRQLNNAGQANKATYFDEGDNPKDEIEWIFQVEKQRTFKEKLLGRAKMTAQDGCFQYFLSLY